MKNKTEKTSKEITKIAASNPISFTHFLSPPQVDESWLIDDLLDLAVELNVEMPTAPLKADFIEALRRGSGGEVDESQTIPQLIQKLESLNIQVPQAPIFEMLPTGPRRQIQTLPHSFGNNFRQNLS